MKKHGRRRAVRQGVRAAVVIIDWISSADARRTQAESAIVCCKNTRPCRPCVPIGGRSPESFRAAFPRTAAQHALHILPRTRRAGGIHRRAVLIIVGSINVFAPFSDMPRRSNRPPTIRFFFARHVSSFTSHFRRTRRMPGVCRAAANATRPSSAPHAYSHSASVGRR